MTALGPALLLLAFVALGVAAMLWGADSRDGLLSREHEQAHWGMAWDGPQDRPRPVLFHARRTRTSAHRARYAA